MKCPHCQQDFVPEVVADSTQSACPFCGKIITLDRTAHPMSCPRCHTRMSIENWMLGSPVLCPGCGEAVVPEPDSEQPTLKPGQIIGQYQIVRHLGSGGMAEVYQATQTLLGVDYALKLLKPEVAQSSILYREQFMREARLACRLQHPNLITVIDANCDPATGWYYIVMDYVDGQSAEELVFQGALPEAQVRHIAQGVTAALIEAERYNLVHRDIKPANIMLDRQGKVKLADLGLAMQEGVTDGEENAIFGTPNYASPEQLNCSSAVDTRSDLYSLGATMYHLLTGSRPYGEGRPEDIATRVRQGQLPPPCELNPAISPELNALIVRLMAADPAARPQNASELQTCLQQLPSSMQVCPQPEPVNPRPVTPTPRHQFRRLILLGLIAVLVIWGAATGYKYYSKSKAERDLLAQLAESAPANELIPSPPPDAPKAPPKPPKSSRPAAPQVAAKPAPTAPRVGPIRQVIRKVVRKAPPKVMRKAAPPQFPPRVDRYGKSPLSRQQRLEQVKKLLAKLKKQPKVDPERLKFHQSQLQELQTKRTPGPPSSAPVRFSPLLAPALRVLTQCAELPMDFPFSSEEGAEAQCLIRLLKKNQFDPNTKLQIHSRPQPILALTVSGHLPYGRHLAKALLKAGANVNQTLNYTSRFTPEMILAENDIERFHRDGSNLLLRNLLAAGEDVFLHQLHKIIENKRWKPDAINAVNALLDLNCQVRVALPGGVTPLHLAASYGLYSISEKILWCGGDPNARDAYGETPLFYAVRNGNRNVANLLVAHGAKINVTNRKRQKVTDLALQGKFARAVLRGKTRQIAELLKQGADPNGLTALNTNALQTTILFNYLPATEVLLKQSLNVNAVHPWRYAIKVPPLTIALYRDQPEMFHLLLRQGANQHTKIGRITMLEHLSNSLKRSFISPVEPRPLPYICELINNRARLSTGRRPYDIAESVLQTTIDNHIFDRHMVPLLLALRNRLPPQLINKYRKKLEDANYRKSTIRIFTPGYIGVINRR